VRVLNAGVSTHQRGRLFVALAAVAWSTAGILQRELPSTPDAAGGRALFAMLGLVAYVAVVERGAVVPAFRAIGRAVCLSRCCSRSRRPRSSLAEPHVGRERPLMQALAPVLAAVLGMLLGESVGRRTWLAMGSRLPASP
jgi:drug/metabolite transporter (DMT)-like permease